MSRDSTANIRHVLSRRCAALGIPVSGIFELTPRCNLRCKMCYVRLTPGQMAPLGRELTARQWLDLAQEAKDAGLTFLLLTGGEPTLRSDFCEIYEALAQMGFSISINTNGTLLTPELRRLWHRLPPAQVNITLYGVSEADYEVLCGDGSAFTRVTEALGWLKQEGILTHLNTTIVPTNFHQWENIEEFARQRELELRMTSYCFPPARRSECGPCGEFIRLSPEDAAELTVRDILWREGPEPIRARAATMSSPPQASCELDSGEAMQCVAGRSQFWMAWNGDMTPCGMLPQPRVLPLVQGFATAWERLRELTAAIRLCPECAACPEKGTCMICAAVNYTETGRFDGKPEYMCRLNQAYRQCLTDLAQTK